MTQSRLALCAGTALLCMTGVVVSCSSVDADDGRSFGTARPGGEFEDGALPPGPSGTGGTASFDEDGRDAPVPEAEVKLDFKLPQAGKQYVYAVNPASDSVAVIDAGTLAIHTVEAGDEPTFLQTLTGTDQAIVLNVGSSDATIIRTENGKSTTAHVDIHPGSNAIAVSPDGKHAVAYFDAERSSGGPLSGSFHDITVITMAPGEDTSTRMTVGFRPRSVDFAEDGSRAFVVTESGVSILDFSSIDDKGTSEESSSIANTVPLASGSVAQTLDVSITPDGRYALARAESETILRLVDLDSGEIKTVDLGTYGSGQNPAQGGGGSGANGNPETGVVTDLDLSPEGDFAVAVIRQTSTVLKLPVPEAFSDATTIERFQLPEEVIGSVTLTDNADRALLYTTAFYDIERLSVLELETGNIDTVDLKKSVKAVTVSPDDETAFIVHGKRPGDPDDAGLTTDQAIDRAHGYSVMLLDNMFSKLQLTPTEVGPLTMVPDGSYLFLLLESVKEVQRIGLDDFLVDRIALGSPPVSIGVVPGSQKVFVGQTHQDGRITFINWETTEASSVTGFELNSRIREYPE